MKKNNKLLLNKTTCFVLVLSTILASFIVPFCSEKVKAAGEKIKVTCETGTYIQKAEISVGKIADNAPKYNGYTFSEARYKSTKIESIYYSEEDSNYYYKVNDSDVAGSVIIEPSMVKLYYDCSKSKVKAKLEVIYGGATIYKGSPAYGNQFEKLKEYAEITGIPDEFEYNRGLTFRVEPKSGFRVKSMPRFKYDVGGTVGITVDTQGDFWIKDGVKKDGTLVVELERSYPDIFIDGNYVTATYEGESYNLMNGRNRFRRAMGQREEVNFQLSAWTSSPTRLQCLHVDYNHVNNRRSFLEYANGEFSNLPEEVGEEVVEVLDNYLKVKVKKIDEKCTYDVNVSDIRGIPLYDEIFVYSEVENSSGSNEVFAKQVDGVEPIAYYGYVYGKGGGWKFMWKDSWNANESRLTPDRHSVFLRANYDSYFFLKLTGEYSPEELTYRIENENKKNGNREITTIASGEVSELGKADSCPGVPYSSDIYRKLKEQGYHYYIKIPADTEIYKANVYIEAKEPRKSYTVKYDFNGGFTPKYPFDFDNSSRKFDFEFYDMKSAWANNNYKIKKFDDLNLLGCDFVGWQLGDKVYKTFDEIPVSIDGNDEFAKNADEINVVTLKALWKDRSKAEKKIPYKIEVFLGNNKTYTTSSLTKDAECIEGESVNINVEDSLFKQWISSSIGIENFFDKYKFDKIETTAQPFAEGADNKVRVYYTTDNSNSEASVNYLDTDGLE